MWLYEDLKSAVVHTGVWGSSETISEKLFLDIDVSFFTRTEI